MRKPLKPFEGMMARPRPIASDGGINARFEAGMGVRSYHSLELSVPDESQARGERTIGVLRFEPMGNGLLAKVVKPGALQSGSQKRVVNRTEPESPADILRVAITLLGKMPKKNKMPLTKFKAGDFSRAAIKALSLQSQT